MKHTKEKSYTIYNASCLDVMDSMEANSIDCIVTDPPYEIGFMGKKWDNTGIAFSNDTWSKALRVLKPGGYLLAFNHSRTFHRMMVAIEDAGFELRDTIMWIYGSGFPKSHNVGLSIDKKLGHEDRGHRIAVANRFHPDGTREGKPETLDKYIGKTPEGNKYDGYGTALKPAFEPIVMARKPFKTSVAENVLTYGVGGINIDECRIEGIKEGDPTRFQNVKRSGGSISIFANGGLDNDNVIEQNGRFPANIIHDGSAEAVSGFPDTTSGGSCLTANRKNEYNDYTYQFGGGGNNDIAGSSGSASRYFYTAKASVKDRDDGLSEFTPQQVNDGRLTEIDNAYQRGETLRKNIHPTVKPTDLMQYLIRLVAPKGSTVLDIFMGSGSTGKAAMIENTERNADYHFIGIDLEEEYCDIAKARIEWGINFRELKNVRVVYDESGEEQKAVQEKFDL